MGTYYPAPTKPTPVDTTASRIQPTGNTASGGGAADPGAASAVDHAHVGPTGGSVPAPPAGVAGIFGGAAIQQAPYYGGGLVGRCGSWAIQADPTSGPGAIAIGASNVLGWNPQTGEWRLIPVTTPGYGGRLAYPNGPGVNAYKCVASSGVTDELGRLYFVSAYFDVSGGNAAACGYYDPANMPNSVAWVPLPQPPNPPLGLAYYKKKLFVLCPWGTSPGGTGVAPSKVYSYDLTRGAAGSWVLHSSAPNNTFGTWGITSGNIRNCGAGIGSKFLVVDSLSGTSAYSIDLDSGVWTQVATGPNNAELYSVCGIGGRYVYVGFAANAPYGQLYDAVANTWATAARYPPGDGYTGTACAFFDLGGKMVTWVTNGGAPVAVPYIFDPTINAWIGQAAPGIVTLSGKVAVVAGAPTVAAGAALGTAPPAPTVAGNDARGTALMGTGTATAAGNAAVVTFASAYGAAPVVQLTALNAAAAALQPYIAATAAGSFTIGFGVAPAVSQAAGTYQLAFHVIG